MIEQLSFGLAVAMRRNRLWMWTRLQNAEDDKNIGGSYFLKFLENSLGMSG
jgi:hypothetical protein